MFTPDIDLKVITRCSKFSIQDKTGVETTGDGTLWGATGSTGLNPVTLSSVVLRIISPSLVTTDYEVLDEVPVPVTGEWWFDDLTGTNEDGLHNIYYRLKIITTISITAFADYNSTVVGTTLVTSNTHGLVTGMYIIISGTTNYNGEYYVTRVNDNTFYITKTFVADDATGTGEKMYQSVFYPYVYCNAEAGVEKMYANISRMVKGSTRDAYLENARTAYGLLGSLKSAISSANTSALTAILAEINHILDYYEIDLNL
jgi:hypothetical protein